MPLNYCLDIFQTVIVGVKMPLNYCLDIFQTVTVGVRKPLNYCLDIFQTVTICFISRTAIVITLRNINVKDFKA